MAEVVLGVGASHTPLFTLESEEWSHRADADRSNPKLNLSDGRWITYDALLAERGPVYEAVAQPHNLKKIWTECEAALDHLSTALLAAAPDVVVVVGDDQGEMFSSSNQPGVAIFHADELTTSGMYGEPKLPGWVQKMGKGYLMDERRVLKGHREFALGILEQLVEQGIDVTSVASTPQGVAHEGGEAGLGHAFGFIVRRLLRNRDIPIVPILLNTYFPPNVPTARRCHDIGQALRKAIEADPRPLRVAIVASGGLSHFVVDADLDARVLAGLDFKQADKLRSLRREELHSGSSEILNWVLTAGAMEGFSVDWQRYFPIYRTPAGTGIGAAFVLWGVDQAVGEAP